MNMHELLTPQEESSWRQKGLDKATVKIDEVMSQDWSQRKKFDALHTLFESLEETKSKCGAHFSEDGEYKPADLQGLYSVPEDIVPTYTCYLKVQAMQKAYCDAMETLPLSRVNGTSEIFNDCVLRSASKFEGFEKIFSGPKIKLPEFGAPAYK